MEEYEEVRGEGSGKTVLLAWGKGVDEVGVVEGKEGGGWGGCWGRWWR